MYKHVRYKTFHNKSPVIFDKMRNTQRILNSNGTEISHVNRNENAEKHDFDKENTYSEID